MTDSDGGNEGQPIQQNAADVVAGNISDAVLNILKTMRHGKDQAPRQRRSRVTVESGRNISFEDFNRDDENNNSSALSKKPWRKRKTPPLPQLETSESSNNNSEVESDSDNEVPYILAC